MSQLSASRSPRVRREYAAIERAMRRVDPGTARFDARPHPPEAVQRARDRWASQLRAEHRSAFVFSALAGQMAEAGDPVDLVAVTMRMAQDELRHTHTCAEVVRALGGEPVLPLLVSVPSLAVHAGESPRQRALRNVLLTTCISEMHAIASFVVSLDVTTDEYLRARTREVLADEVLHGELGFAYLEAAQPWLRDDARERDAVARYLRFAFAWAERELTPAPAPGSARRETTSADLALGALPADVARDLYARTMADAVVPALEALSIAAHDAWIRRSLV